MGVGDMVIEIGPCRHIRSKNFKDCFHRPGSIEVAFQDMESYLVKNQIGYVRRIMRAGLVAA